MHYFCIFFKYLNKPCVDLLRVWTKNANFWEILRKFWKFLMKILLKNWICILYLFVILFFENLLLNIKPSEITQVFYNNLFGFGGGVISPLSPCLRPWLGCPMQFFVFYACVKNISHFLRISYGFYETLLFFVMVLINFFLKIHKHFGKFFLGMENFLSVRGTRPPKTIESEVREFRDGSGEGCSHAFWMKNYGTKYKIYEKLVKCP